MKNQGNNVTSWVGTWHTYTGSLSMAGHVQDALGEYAHLYDIHGISEDLQETINDQLSEGIGIAGDNFYYDISIDGDVATAEIKETVDSVLEEEFWAIASANLIPESVPSKNSI